MGGKKILIVEDEAIQGMAAKDVLVKDGYDVMPVPFTGEEAIQLIEQSPPDLAIIDITLGDEIDGIQVARHLLEKHKVPIIYLTAHTDDETIDEAKKTEPFGFIYKPCEDRDLLKMVAEALKDTDT
ncbi:MAG TPA: response regulator [Nitrospirae bacterium]|nr:response regulator [Nitrospirota bacterium]